MQSRSLFAAAWFLFAAGSAAQAPTPLVVTGLDAGAPLRITADLSPTRLVVHVALDAGWHLYGKDTGNGQPVRIEIAAESAFAADGALATPMDAHGEITGAADLELPLRRRAPGDAFTATLRFMTCDALQCLPPMAVTLATPAPAARPLAVLLVVDVENERSARIAELLTARGLRPTVTTYGKATVAQCDASDAVLCDSPCFGKTDARAQAIAFPETKAPLVAVGWLGTELLEAQRVSMACGYI